MRKINPETIAAPGGSYTHGIAAPAGSECVYISGQVGTDANGVVPSDLGAQSELCWKSLVEILKAANMTFENLTKVTVFLKEGWISPRWRQRAAATSEITGRHPRWCLSQAS